MVRPRQHAAALEPIETRDAMWLIILYLVGTQGLTIAKAIATLWALGNLSGIIGGLSMLGRGVLVPILALVGAESLLGSERAYQRAVVLLPMVVIGSIAHLLGRFDLWVAIGSAAIGLALVLSIRTAVPPMESP